MGKIISMFISIIVLQITLHAENISDYNLKLCKRITKLSKESKSLYNDFNDTKSALILLQNSQFKNIAYYKKPECLNRDDYIKYINQYSLYLSESINYYPAQRFLENIIKKYPDNPPTYLYLGNIYKKIFTKRRIVKYRQKAIEMYTKYVELSKVKNLPIKKEVSEFLKNGGLEKVNETWGKYLNPTNTAPINKFKAFYINTNKPKKIIASEIVDNISVNYPYNEFHNIDSKDFGAYWVGDFIFKKDTKMQINISQSWAKTRVIIDNLIVYQGDNNAQIPFVFKKGKHKIEVEYINNWHTTDFSVVIMPYHKRYNLKELKTKLSLGKDINVWYAGIYESSSKDHSVEVNLKKSDKPVVILLQSYETTKWKINNKFNDKISAIIVGESKPGSQVIANIPKSLIYFSNFKLGYSELYPKCSCYASIFHCEGGSIIDTNRRILSILDKKADGFSGKYSTKSITLPNIILDAKKYSELNLKLDEINKKRKECSEKIDSNFNSIFKDTSNK